uniref:Uncharacterized protein n=1 Tax=Heterorhabditis bacteriophora TaxID=37862 RepID=A0A1I7WAL0_HETBA
MGSYRHFSKMCIKNIFMHNFINAYFSTLNIL